MSYLALAEKVRAEMAVKSKQSEPPRAWIIEELRDGAGRLQAVKVCSALLQDHLYVVFDDEFIPPEPLATYSEEKDIPAMRGKSPETVVAIHKVKVVFPGARVIQ